MRILITGAAGLLGSHLAAAWAMRHTVLGVDRNPWWGDAPVPLAQGDLDRTGWIEKVMLDFRPDALVHCAAWADVDGCEKDPSRAYANHAELTRRIARALAPGTRMVYISTDGVFKGDRPLAREEWLPCPRTVYGRAKRHGEWETELAAENHLILRTNFYGWSSGRKKTFAEWLHEALALQREITLFDDFYFTPIYVADLAPLLGGLVESRHRGIFHLAGAQRVSKHEFGKEMARQADFSMSRVRVGSIRQAALVAPRPRDMSLDCSKFVQATGQPVPDLRSGLAHFLKHRGVPLSARFPGAAAEVIR